MSDRAYIRVKMDGNRPRRELCVDGVKIADLTYHDVLALALNATSSLRWENERIPAGERASSSKAS